MRYPYADMKLISVGVGLVDSIFGIAINKIKINWVLYFNIAIIMIMGDEVF